MNDNIAMSASEPETGARKVGTYDIPDDKTKGTPPPTPPEPRRGLSWLWWLLGLIVLLALLAWAFNSCMAPDPGNPPAATATPVAALNMVGSHVAFVGVDGFLAGVYNAA